MRRGKYHTDWAGRLYCRHGVILHGNSCVTCEREGYSFEFTAEDLLNAGPTPKRANRYQGKRADRIIIDDPWTGDAPDPDDVERVAASLADALKRRTGQGFENTIFGSSWRDTATCNPIEVITDPADRRGFDAKPARVALCARRKGSPTARPLKSGNDLPLRSSPKSGEHQARRCGAALRDMPPGDRAPRLSGLQGAQTGPGTVTWITDGTGTRWVPLQPRKRRKPARALRFANLKEGDVLLVRHSWREERHDPPCVGTAVANDNRKTLHRTAVSFAIAERLWFDPVAGETDPVAGQMVAVRALTSRGPAPTLWRHTLRGLATNGYHPTTPDQGRAVLAWMADRDRLTAQFEAGQITAEEARAAHKPWRVLLRELGIEPAS